MELGFIGLGHLGKAIAGRLAGCGHSLNVWNRSPEKYEGLDANPSDSVKDLVSKSDVIFLCLFDSSAVKSVITDPSGILSTDIKGKIVVDLSTNHFEEVELFHRLISEAGGFYLESPVLGSVVPASKGALTVLVSGEKSAYEKVKPLLEDIGKEIFFLEETGRASKMKLINNLTLGGFMAIIAEALALGEKAGLNKKDILDILSAGGGKSLVLDAKKQKLIDEDFSVHFSNALIYKDLHCLQDYAYKEKVSLLTGSLIKEIYGEAFKYGIESDDFSSVYKILKK